MRVGEDLAGQVQSSRQYIEGFTKAPNYCSYPKTSDLSQNTSTWSPRPPVASWITLPGLYLGMSIGDSLRLIFIHITNLWGYRLVKIIRSI